MAINLSDLFSYEELERKEGDQDALEMKRLSHTGSKGPADEQDQAAAETQQGPPADMTHAVAQDARVEDVDDVSAGQQAAASTLQGAVGGPSDAAAVVSSGGDEAQGAAQPSTELGAGDVVSPPPAPLAAGQGIESGPPSPRRPSGEAATEEASTVVDVGVPSADPASK